MKKTLTTNTNDLFEVSILAPFLNLTLLVTLYIIQLDNKSLYHNKKTQNDKNVAEENQN